MIMVLGVHFTRASDVIVPDYLTTDPAVAVVPYRDGFGTATTWSPLPARGEDPGLRSALPRPGGRDCYLRPNPCAPPSSKALQSPDRRSPGRSQRSSAF